MATEVLNSTEIWPSGFAGARNGLCVTSLSACVFFIFSLITDFIRPKVAEKQRWRWKNISVSLLHAVISGIGAIVCFIGEPRMTEDLIKTHTTEAHLLVSASVGYFVYDILDMLLYQRNRQTCELFIHHCVIIFCFGIAVLTKIYIGYALLALVVEINSIFLHLRQLLQCCGFQRTNSIYRLNSLINLGTFLGFRVLTLCWMTRWIVINKDVIPLPFYSIGSIGLATITVMNIVLFYRLLHSDFLRKKESHHKEE